MSETNHIAAIRKAWQDFLAAGEAIRSKKSDQAWMAFYAARQRVDNAIKAAEQEQPTLAGEVSHQRQSKVTGPVPPSGPVRAIVKVDPHDYRPAGVTIRTVVGGGMFTAEFDVALLADLEADPRVLRVASSEPLQRV